MAKVRKFNLDLPAQAESSQTDIPALVRNAIPELSHDAIERVTATAPVQIRPAAEIAKPGHPRKRRYRLKTYSLLPEDIAHIEALLTGIRMAGLHDRSRSDIVRAGVTLMFSLPIEKQVKAVEAVENLRSAI